MSELIQEPKSDPKSDPKSEPRQLNNNNNNLRSAEWGPYGWKFIHCVGFGYPDNPTPEDKTKYKTFFETIGYILPCVSCRTSYQKHISDGPCKISEQVFDSRDNVTRWLYNLHNCVNSAIQVKFKLTYEQMVENYKKFRVDCEESGNSLCEQRPEEQKIIPEDIARSFTDYAKLRGVSDYSDKLDYYAKLAELTSLDKVQKEDWEKRNLLIDSKRKTIMNTNTVQPYSYYVELIGEYAGYPTVALLEFLCLLYSPICVSELKKISLDLPKLTELQTSPMSHGGSAWSKKYKLTKSGKLVQDL